MTVQGLKALLVTSVLVTGSAAAQAAGGEADHIGRQHWSFGGFNGQFDTAQLQRGFQVYQEKCASCHGLSRLRFRNLVEEGGPEFPEEAVKELAKSWPNKITDGPNDAGEMFDRDAKLPDPILGPFKNAKAAAAALGAAPPDLSVMARARNTHNASAWPKHVFIDMPKDILSGYQEGGADYIHAILTGYEDAPAGVVLAQGLNYNKAFPGHQIAMPPPLGKDNFTAYQDGNGSLEENSRDVTAFLSWAADPSLNSRKRMGWQVMLYLLVTTILLYIGKRRVWSKLH